MAFSVRSSVLSYSSLLSKPIVANRLRHGPLASSGQVVELAQESAQVHRVCPLGSAGENQGPIRGKLSKARWCQAGGIILSISVE